MCLRQKTSSYCVYSCEYPCLNERLQQCTLGRCHPSPAFPTEQDWTSFAEWGWEERLRLTSPLNQGCIELEMDEVVDETHVGRTCDFHLVHSHPPNPLHAHSVFHPPKDAVLLSKRLKIMKMREMGLPCGSDQAEKRFQGVGSHGKQCRGRREENRALCAKGGSRLSLAQLPLQEQLPISPSPVARTAAMERSLERQEKKNKESFN